MRFRYTRCGLALFVLLGACGSNSDASPKLITTDNPSCAAEGRTLAEYLISGHGSPTLEQSYASKRSEILRAPNEARAGLARATADDYITECDAQIARGQEYAAKVRQEERDGRQAKADAAVAQRAEDARSAEAKRVEGERVAAYASTCAAHAGTVNGASDCVVSYPGWNDQRVPMNRDGTFDTANANVNRQNCETDTADAASGAVDGHPWSRQPVYHEDTGVCVPGAP